MKPTREQIEVIDAIKDVIEYWATTNDINSPSHFSLCNEWYSNLRVKTEDKIEELGLKQLIANQILELLYSVRKIK